MTDRLVVRGAREHNLQNVSVDLPRDRLIVFTGLSGSGKSSLAFDTIYAEGQRRYVESLSAYARQFLGQMDKPDVDFIEGLSPAISIDQKSASRNPRSTVGTITEIYDYLRLLYARIGIPHCPRDGSIVTRQTPQQIVDRILELPDGTRFQVLAPVVRGRKGEYEGLLDELAGQGFVRARVDGAVAELADRKDIKLARYENHTIEVIVDRLVKRKGIERRLTDSLETALRLAEGVAEIQIVGSVSQPAKPDASTRRVAEAIGADEEPGGDEILTFSQHLACPTCGQSFDELAPRNFSFNSPYGACPVCSGLGTRYEVDPELRRPQPRPLDRRGRNLAVVGGPQRVVPTGLVLGSGGPGFPHVRGLGQAQEGRPEGCALRNRVPVRDGLLPQPLRPDPAVLHALRRGRPVVAAAPRRSRVRRHSGADRGLHARGALHRVRGRPPQAGVVGGDHRRPQHPRAVRHEHR